MIEDKNFNKFMEEFKKLPIHEKKVKVIEYANAAVNLIVNFRDNYGVPQNIVYNKEILDVRGEHISEDDFVEAMYAYLYMIVEGNSEIINAKLDNMEEN